VKWEGWDENDYTWEPEENMAKANDLLKQYWKEIGRRPKAERNTTLKKASGAVVFGMVERHCGGMFFSDQGKLFLREVSRR